jgi:hypothetical protein
LDFEIIESKLSISLPEYYKLAISNYPFKALDNLEFVEDNLVNNEEWLIQTNIELRECSFFGNTWPSHFFAIGHDGFGNFTFINVKEFVPPDIEDLELCSNMKKYIQDCLEEQKDVLSD